MHKTTLKENALYVKMNNSNQERDERMGFANGVAALFGVEKGVHPPYNKNTAETATVEMPPAQRVTVSMLQHVGAPCTPVVAKGDKVKVGQLLGDSNAAVSAPIHSGVSGTVCGIGELVLPNGTKAVTVEIESDGEQTVWEGVEPPHIHGREDMVTAVRASGLVGLGGAGFPTHVKFALYKDGQIDTLVINGAECEPYITADYREALENTWDIMNGIMITADHFKARRTVIAVENNKPAAIAELSKVAETCSTAGHRISVASIPSMYPQGAEKMLIQNTTGRRIPPGKLPSDVGCCVMNITSTAFVSRYLKDGMPLVARRMTVDGSGIERPSNLRVTIGTQIRDIVEFCGGYKGDAKRIIMGGPMMGNAVYTDTQPVLKQNNAILVFAGRDGEKPPQSACIRCGRCVGACPMNLVPPAISAAFDKKDVSELIKCGVMNCVECGCCTFSCPAKRQIVQMMRLAKNLVRREGKK